MTPSESSTIKVRGLRCHLRSWGPREAPSIMLLHGWMDASASFQFLADALGGRWRCIAPDWRGFGLSEWAPGGVYSYPDYLADLDAIARVCFPEERVRLVGHSLGGNIACMYAAVRPDRVSGVVDIEGFGLRARQPAEAPGQLAEWLDQLRADSEAHSYASFEELAERVRSGNPRIGAERSAFVAGHWGKQDDSGRIVLRADPAHDRVSPIPWRLDEAKALWSAITAPVLWIEAAESQNCRRHHITPQDLEQRRGSIATVKTARIENAGHMVHLEQPERLAQAIEVFFKQA